MIEFEATIQETKAGQFFITLPKKMMEFTGGKKKEKVKMQLLNLDGKEWNLKFEDLEQE